MRDFFGRIRGKFERRRNIRKLEVTRSGKWYIALTIALGVTALASGNNAIYLMESLLLAGLILSGVLSERQVSSVRVEFLRVQAKAADPTADWIIVRNQSKRTLFCLEIGEWKDGHFHSLAFFPKVKESETARARSEQTLASRGLYRWDGFAVATSYPFGFARKIKVVKIPGERIVWPNAFRKRNGSYAEPVGERGHRNPEIDVVDGEIRKYEWVDDARLILANQSDRGVGPMVRNRRPVLKEPEVLLDLRVPPGEAFENTIRLASSAFYRSENAELILVQSKGRRKVTGKKAALNALALAESEELR
jgi:uncharacterized protein (DUF58 family)